MEEIVELRSSRAPSGMDLVDTHRKIFHLSNGKNKKLLLYCLAVAIRI